MAFVADQLRQRTFDAERRLELVRAGYDPHERVQFQLKRGARSITFAAEARLGRAGVTWIVQPFGDGPFWGGGLFNSGRVSVKQMRGLIAEALKAYGQGHGFGAEAVTVEFAAPRRRH